MDLSILKKYFQSCEQAQNKLQQYRDKLHKIPCYSLFKCLAPQNQPKLDGQLIRRFVITFNWQILLSEPNSHANANINNSHAANLAQSSYRVHSTKQRLNPEQLLDYGIELLLAQWGGDRVVNFDQFSLFVKGEHQVPSSNSKQVDFMRKRDLFQCLITQMQSLINLQILKKEIYHQYKNLSDLFETITNSKLIQLKNIQNLFLTFSQRKSQKELNIICKRAKIPWSFQDFLNLFKKNNQLKSNEKKVYYSSNRNKKHQFEANDTFTTPKKQKNLQHISSTKLSKNLGLISNKLQKKQDHRTPSKIHLHTFSTEYKSQQYGKKNYLYVQILAQLLGIEQEFIEKCWNLVKRRDFDLQLVYERHGKKFQKILNERYGVCNFSAFVRFIVPREYEHRYLCFIRYQQDDTLSQQTDQLIDQLIDNYYHKQNKIEQLWGKCDKQLLFRHFCSPAENSIKNQKIKQIFSQRQTKILLQRLDPHNLGQILLQAIN